MPEPRIRNHRSVVFTVLSASGLLRSAVLRLHDPRDAS